jgi:hypothetical protein
MNLALQSLLSGPIKPSRILVGFDGYVDSLYHVVRERSAQAHVAIADIPEFAREIAARAGRSGGFELSRMDIRAGGNAQLMASGLAALGADVDCVGSMGLPGLDPAFTGLAARCRLHSIAPAAGTVALEFGDGKIMLGDTKTFETLNWARLVEVLGLDSIQNLVADAELIALVNWANLPLATDLWKGLLEQCLEKLPAPAKPRRIFFDLADLTRCGADETRALMKLIGHFRPHGQVSLGLNENEAYQLAEKLGLDKHDSLEHLGHLLLTIVEVDVLVIHPRDRAVVFHDGEVHSVAGRVVSKVLLSTGGGDHFNAGFCMGLMNGLTPQQAAGLAVLVSSLYVEQGRSPSREELRNIV